jgi:hypothetical protein
VEHLSKVRFLGPKGTSSKIPLDPRKKLSKGILNVFPLVRGALMTQFTLGPRRFPSVSFLLSAGKHLAAESADAK